jgi:transcriptional regulator with XRE-family HTH domain
MNPLARYLDKTRLTQTQFSRRFGIANSQVSNWLHGNRRPSLDAAFRLEDATDGAIPARAWMKKKTRRLAA